MSNTAVSADFLQNILTAVMPLLIHSLNLELHNKSFY